MNAKYIFPLLISAAAVLAGCEQNIGPDDRYIPVEDPEPMRYVLIEEYTGIDCKNCPDGHKRLAEIEAYYNTEANAAKGAGVISVGIHIPVFGDPIESGGFVTPEASQLAPGQTTAPAARINRRTEVLELDRWQSAVSTEITRNASVKFANLKAEISADGNISVTGSAEAVATVNGTKLQLWVVEDDIIDWQLQNNGSYDSQYKHHAVYRCSLTGFEGQPIELSVTDATDFSIANQSIPAVCNKDNLRIVAFIETDEDGVLNAAQTNVIKI